MICNIVGARPHFVKYFAIKRHLGEDLLIHTGQHYDYEMSKLFFEEFHLKKPDYHLDAGNCVSTTTRKVREVLQKEKPEIVVVYGDTNSTLGGTLAANSLNIPVAHVEAGVRSFSTIIEEYNRIKVDKYSTWRFCPSLKAVENLKNEGLDGVFTGDVMKDVILKTKRRKIPKPFNLLTIHRAGNTTPEKFQELMDFVKHFSKTYFPIHPRTKKLFKPIENIAPLKPLSYVELVSYIDCADIVLTDSGGIQKEAYWLKTPCITLRDETEWTETIDSGWNVLWKDSLGGFSFAEHPDHYGDGEASKKIVEILNRKHQQILSHPTLTDGESP